MCGSKVPVATIGTVLYDKEGGSFNIKGKPCNKKATE
jgi:hypothetical protein